MTDQPHPKGSVSSREQKKWRFSPGAFCFIVGVTAVVGFAVGMRGDVIVRAIAPSLGFTLASPGLDLSDVQHTYHVLKKNFDGSLDQKKLIEGASRGMVAAADDQYTVFMDEKEADEFDKDLSGKIGGGVGAEIGLRNNMPTIIRTLKDTPAAKSGLMAGDTIIAVNDTDASTWTVEEAVKHIRGEVGTTVKIAVLRDNQQKEFTITRESISSPSVEAKVENGVGILTISRFDESTSETARRAGQDFKSQNVKKVIIDLRGNGGGYLTAAQDVAGLWLEDKVVVSERRNGKVTDELRSGKNAPLEGIPTVVLVNAGSASASEIVAGALQDHGAAKLMGEKTYGKGSVQKLAPLTEGAMLKVTIAKWYTPKGKNITKEGISPDKVIDLNRDDVNAGRDPQLDAARAFN